MSAWPESASSWPARLLLAYGVNLRSRAGADAATLRRTVTAALDSIGARAAA
ncbi:hypothetical protein SAV14893_081680 [Streptomyces avermitilis]|uniref:Uncharacterized protein n=1 Tax=Streptomyces avermitilis TaxID=33903 RepID=A0A4D4MFR7_STRAX|nr:hypothetical protein SAV14893_081680 [Streptomyces avermitilis]GDY70842.1 hypothetical protein SAV31267_003270 [Streptomyces avermitilis]